MASANGKGIWAAIILLAGFLGGSFAFTLNLYFRGQEALDRTREALQVQIDSRWSSVGAQMDRTSVSMNELIRRMRVIECALGDSSCVTFKIKPEAGSDDWLFIDQFLTMQP